jgi:hypothetical protein
VRERAERLRHQHRAHREKRGEGGLRDHHAHAPAPVRGAAGRARPALAQRRADVELRALQRRHQREQQRRGRGQHEGEDDRPRVDRRERRARHVGRHRRAEYPQRARRERQADRGGERRQRHSLDELLRHEPAAAAAHRRAQTELALPGRAAREQQARDVGAGDQQQQHCRPGGDRDRRPVRSQDLVRHRHREGAVLDAGVVLAFGRELLRRRAQLLGGARHARSGHELGRAVVAVVAERREVVLVGRPRHVELRGLGRVLVEVGGQREARRHHADHLVGHAVELDAAPDQGGVAGEAALPQRVAQHHDVRPAGAVFLGRDAAAEKGPRAEHREGARGDEADVDARRLAVAREVLRVEGPVRDPREARAALGVRAHLGGVDPGLVEAAPAVPDHHATRRVLVRQRREHDRVGQAEDRGARRDAERERADGEDGEAGRAPEQAQRVAQLVGQGAPPGLRRGRTDPRLEPPARRPQA